MIMFMAWMMFFQEYFEYRFIRVNIHKYIDVLMFQGLLQIYMLYFILVEAFKWIVILAKSSFMSLSPRNLFFSRVCGVRYSITCLSTRSRLNMTNNLRTSKLSAVYCLFLPWCLCQRVARALYGKRIVWFDPYDNWPVIETVATMNRYIK